MASREVLELKDLWNGRFEGTRRGVESPTSRQKRGLTRDMARYLKKYSGTGAPTRRINKCPSFHQRSRARSLARGPLSQMVDRKRTCALERKRDERGQVREIDFNWAPEAETPSSFTELNPYRRWTVTIATSKTAAVGILARTTKAPSIRAKPPTSSVPIVSHAAMCGSGTPYYPQDRGKCIRASRQFRETVLDEAVRDEDAHWATKKKIRVRLRHRSTRKPPLLNNGSPAVEERSERPRPLGRLMRQPYQSLADTAYCLSSCPLRHTGVVT
jgi:hypothetical protein